jgi:S-methylmethionine-dependent homocysteine/selenocysteine methylase
MRPFLDKHDLVLMEAAVVERLRRDSGVELHPSLVHATLVHDALGRRVLAKIYQGYIDIALEASLPLLLCAPTWRANRERVREAGGCREINSEAVGFMGALRDLQRSARQSIKIGGLIGCRNDCYRPDEALSPAESEEFHSWQIRQLAEAGVDYLIAATLPDVGEAIGIARGMSATDVPYIISFVIDREGRVLDGTPLWEAVSILDESERSRPLGFMVGCAHPSFLNAAQQPPSLFARLIGYQANASSLNHASLDGQSHLQVDDVSAWAGEMLVLNRQYGVKILGGCCGTGVDHLEGLVTLRGKARVEGEGANHTPEHAR